MTKTVIEEGLMGTFEVGQQYAIEITVTDQKVRQFAEVTGDRNRIHLDDEYAATTPFQRRIAHGALLNGFISAALGMGMPGEGTIYLGQNIEYKAPVFIGDRLRVSVCIVELLPKNGARIRASITNQENVLVAEGDARVKLPRPAQRLLNRAA